MSNNKKYGLIGFPLGHSLSPVIHKELFALTGEKGDYELIEIEPEKLKNSFENLKKLDGFNVTIPHKTNIIPFLDALSTKAELFGSVNTVEFNNGKAIGHNTDCIGFLKALETAGIELKGRVLICGCGGVSRMFAFESALAGAEITFAIRKSSLEKCKLLCEELREKLKAESKIVFLDNAGENYDLIINGTPSGMYPNVENCPLKRKTVESSKAVFDSIYNPYETVLLKYARQANIKYQNGLSMLVWQAAKAQEIWKGFQFEEEKVEEVIKKLKIDN
ncbi:MAG: shikimate dehydrogenase [Eubacterium sp.]|nr:shikimate dehydrogenase [Eubacterium sp.]